MTNQNLPSPSHHNWTEFYKHILDKFYKDFEAFTHGGYKVCFHQLEIRVGHRPNPYRLRFLVPDNKFKPPLLQIEDHDITHRDIAIFTDCGVSPLLRQSDHGFLGNALQKVIRHVGYTETHKRIENTGWRAFTLAFTVVPTDMDAFIKKIDELALMIVQRAKNIASTSEARLNPPLFNPKNKHFAPRDTAISNYVVPVEHSTDPPFTRLCSNEMTLASAVQQEHTSSQYGFGDKRLDVTSKGQLPHADSPVAAHPVSSSGFVVRGRSLGYSPIPVDPKKIQFTRDENISLVTSHEGGGAKHEIWLSAKARSMLFAHIGWGDLGRSDNKNEQGGILLGEVIVTPNGRTIGLAYEAIPGQRGRGNPSYLELDTATWIDMYKSVDRIRETAYQGRPAERPLVIIGWYHTHPNSLGIFMSGTDQATQRQMFAKDWQFAIIFNPQRKYWGAFYGGDSRPCIGWLEKESSDGQVLEPFTPLSVKDTVPVSTSNPKYAERNESEEKVADTIDHKRGSPNLMILALLTLVSVSSLIILWIYVSGVSQTNHSLSNKINVINDRIRTQEDNIKQLAEYSSVFSEFKKRIDNLDSRLATETSSITRLNKQIFAAVGSLSSIQSEITENQKLVNEALANVKRMEQGLNDNLRGGSNSQTGSDVRYSSEEVIMQGERTPTESPPAENLPSNLPPNAHNAQDLSTLIFEEINVKERPAKEFCYLCIVSNASRFKAKATFSDDFVADLTKGLTKLINGKKEYKIYLVSKPDNMKAILLEKLKANSKEVLNIGLITQIPITSAKEFGYDREIEDDSLGVFVVISTGDK